MAEIFEIHQKNQKLKFDFFLRNSNFINGIAIVSVKLFNSHSVLKWPDEFTVMPCI
jgi:hypothetical protein